MKLGEIVVLMGNYNFNKFHQSQMKNKKVLLIAYLMDVSSIKVLLRSFQRQVNLALSFEPRNSVHIALLIYTMYYKLFFKSHFVKYLALKAALLWSIFINYMVLKVNSKLQPIPKCHHFHYFHTS